MILTCEPVCTCLPIQRVSRQRSSHPVMDSSAIDERIAYYAQNIDRVQEQQPYRQNVPQGMEGQGMENYDDIDQYEVPVAVMLPKFAKVPNVTEEMMVMTDDFPDNSLFGLASVDLYMMSDREIIDVGRRTLPQLKSGFSLKGIAALLLLALLIKDPVSGTNILEFDWILCNENDIAYDNLSNVTMNAVDNLQHYGPTGKERVEVLLYPYLAASTLRMFTKSEDNYLKAWSRILSQFEKFYGHPPPSFLYMPRIEPLKTLSHQFSNNTLFKATLYKILYMGGTNKKGEGVKRYLYEIHLANTGIHCASIFARLTKVLNCPSGLVLSVMTHHEMETQLDALAQLLIVASSDDENHRRKLWRYGRLFDETFMCILQTKSCARLTYTLGSALKLVAAKTNQDILKIKQLDDIGPEMRKEYDKQARLLISSIRGHYAGAPHLYIFLFFFFFFFLVQKNLRTTYQKQAGKNVCFG